MHDRFEPYKRLWLSLLMQELNASGKERLAVAREIDELRYCWLIESAVD